MDHKIYNTSITEEQKIALEKGDSVEVEAVVEDILTKAKAVTPELIQGTKVKVFGHVGKILGRFYQTTIPLEEILETMQVMRDEDIGPPLHDKEPLYFVLWPGMHQEYIDLVWEHELEVILP